MSYNIAQGKFISFEGIDGCGKSTQVQMLSKYFDDINIEHILTREPGTTEIGNKIREILLNNKMDIITEVFLFAAARTEMVKTVVFDAIVKGKWVISDRYYDSSVAYQGADQYKYVKDLIDVTIPYSSRGITPFITFILDMPVEQSLERAKNRFGKQDVIESRGVEYFEKVRQKFLDIARNKDRNIFVIDATKSKEEVFKQVKKIVDDKISSIFKK